MARITMDDFERVEMRVGRIIAADDFPRARKPSYRLTIDFGPFGVKRSSAAIRPFYAREDLIGRQVVCVINFPPKQIADFVSEVLTLGVVERGGRIVLLQPDREAELGGRIA
ncbi:MAG: tRNA-binding protein [Armatimonadota bacterium]|nr:tRNA-binding protein [Armatimonadota bacterium]MDR7450350.1 tRNA-binding protein [Armatimonadota bacterium]MDR7467067.1 tRNA-binding protein [Armatimonadota bacterium]MDR7493391.1 tRNA-binding protein [Armatimonadota bacterium]MDR7499399.1 tRNA-binding protein [Armatimonadota bacterium]